MTNYTQELEVFFNINEADLIDLTRQELGAGFLPSDVWEVAEREYNIYLDMMGDDDDDLGDTTYDRPGAQ